MRISDCSSDVCSSDLGTTASVHNMHPGIACIEGLRMVDEGKYDFAMTSPAWFAKSAAEGRVDLGWTPRKLDLSAVASFSHDNQLALAVRKDLCIKSIRELGNAPGRERGGQNV